MTTPEPEKRDEEKNCVRHESVLACRLNMNRSIGRAKKWMDTNYHQPADTVRPDWNWDGAKTIAVIGLVTGMRISDTAAMPEWLKRVRPSIIRAGRDKRLRVLPID